MIAAPNTDHFGQPLRVWRHAPVARPVDPNWTCQQSGDCCRAISHVLMTTDEARVLYAAAERRLTIAQLNRVQFSARQPGFVAMDAGPCPMLDGEQTCQVYDVRPYTCRRFGCLRPDVQAEPLQMAPVAPGLLFGSVGCSNLRERLVQSRVARRLYHTMQRKAQRWARKHGWVEQEAAS